MIISRRTKRVRRYARCAEEIASHDSQLARLRALSAARLR
jgi:hypothetical protein